MKNLLNFIKKTDATTRPAEEKSIHTLEENLGFHLSTDYKDFLRIFGVISLDSYEIYGLGVPSESHLNVLNSYKDLSRDKKYPPNATPIFEIGDGHYYLYDNKSGNILLWATPNGGIIKVIDSNLEDFLIQIFTEQ